MHLQTVDLVRIWFYLCMAEIIKCIHNQLRLNIDFAAAGELKEQGIPLIGAVDLMKFLSGPLGKGIHLESMYQNKRTDIHFFL